MVQHVLSVGRCADLALIILRGSRGQRRLIAVNREVIRIIQLNSPARVEVLVRVLQIAVLALIYYPASNNEIMNHRRKSPLELIERILTPA